LKTKDERSRIIIRELTIQIREQERELRATTTTRTRGSTRTTRGRGVQVADSTEQSERTMPIEEEETDKYDPNTQAELDLWLDASVMDFDNTISFAETINEHIREEIRPIRQIADEEKATKTMAAIDGILLARQERLTELTEQLETARARAEETNETISTRGRGRMDQGMTDQDTGGRRRR